MFLQETKLVVKRMEHLKFGLGFECCMAVSCEERSGGITLLWKKNIMVTIRSFSKFHVHASVKGEREADDVWILTGIYCHPHFTKRYEMWNLIISLQVPNDQP